MIRLLLTSGRGPAECRIAVQKTVAALTAEATSFGLATDCAEGPNPDGHGPASAIVVIHGEAAASFARSWIGAIQWTAQSPLRPHHKRKNWFIGAFALPPLPDAPKALGVQDVRFEAFRAGGPGGQHQNKTESGVRYIHLPTGIAAESRTERSQHKNDANAMALLKAKLYRIEEQKRKAEVEKQYDEKGEVAWGYQIRNYVMQPYTLVKDVRTAVETAQVQQVLDGELDEFIQAYLRQKAEREHKKKDEKDEK